MFSFLISFFTAGSFKWIAILMIVFGLASSLYLKHRQIVDMEKDSALQKFTIDQLQQNVKDKNIYIQQMEEISTNKSEILAKLYIERDRLEEQLQKIDASINQHVGAGHDKQSSQILKDTIKMLGEIK
jgi:hypothetical protein